ncbi:hypothetical protein AVEN_252249-1 [Araneus ventricosus]|uniref:Uncharacterized protein n=1 Tax=Araneus ventricosus TaxID=182803 RepID=A0A4Y2TPR8_ARAVE|nr:hypothetical protein AVEN_252249-1 [Araneus ventricosus]
MKLLARCYVCLAKIEEDIENYFSLCEHVNKLYSSTILSYSFVVGYYKAMLRVHIDFAGPFQGQMFFLPVDSFLKWLEEKRLSSGSATSKATKKVMREIFASHGISSHELRNLIMVASYLRRMSELPFKKLNTAYFCGVIFKTTKDALKIIISCDRNQRLKSFLITQHITPTAATGFGPTELLMKI